MNQSIEALIVAAEAVLNPVEVDGHWRGDVGAALETAEGGVYVGVSLDTGSGGLCAERAAGAAMVTAGVYHVRRVVAVWRDSRPGADRTLYVLPPCGTCRQFIYDLAPENVETLVVVGAQDEMPLRELLPLHGWAAKPARGS